MDFEQIPFMAWLIVAAVIMSIVRLIWSWFSRRRRIKQMQAAADELGLPYFQDGDPALIDELKRFELFSQGRHRRIHNMIHGDAGDIEVGIFDYRYTTGHGKHKHTWQQTVAYIRSPHLSLPKFALRPENLFHKIGGALGYDDIDFESHPKFSRTFLLKGVNEERVRAAFSGAVLNYLELQAGISLEGREDKLIYYQVRRLEPPSGVRALMEEGIHIFGLFRDAQAQS